MADNAFVRIDDWALVRAIAFGAAVKQGKQVSRTQNFTECTQSFAE
jgi:hypothetical protein